METSGKSKSAAKVAMKATEATPESFKDYGQVISALPDGDQFGPHDAHPWTSQSSHSSSPMSLTMRVSPNALVPLGDMFGWYLGVAKPSVLDSSEHEGGAGNGVVKSRCGHYYAPPVVDDIVRVFKIEGPKFIKLHCGTWHAGPLFKEDAMDFYNLELSNTNEVDFTTHRFKKENVMFVVDE